MRKYYYFALIGAIAISIPVFGYAQALEPVFNASAKLKPVTGVYPVHLLPAVGQTFHYRVTKKKQVSIKNADDLFKQLNLKADDKSWDIITTYITIKVRSRRYDTSTDFQFRIDSVTDKYDINGTQHNFSSNRPQDMQDTSFFSNSGVFVGKDLGVILDTLGNVKDVYGYYAIDEYLDEKHEQDWQNDTLHANDSLSSDEEPPASNSYTTVKNLFKDNFINIPSEPMVKDSTYAWAWKQDYTLWGNVAFPMNWEDKSILNGFGQEGENIFAEFNQERTINPVERMVEVETYTVTLPNYSYSNKFHYFIDVATGAIAYSHWTMEEVIGLKVEQKSGENSDKSFATVHRTKMETTVEMLK
jgi:hypothetical protein